MNGKRIEQFEEPKAAKWLFASTAAAWIWILPRLYFGWKWFEAGREKISGGWMSDASGLQGFVGYAQTLHEGEHPAVNYDWYVSFLKFVGNNASWMSPVIAVAGLARRTEEALDRFRRRTVVSAAIVASCLLASGVLMVLGLGFVVVAERDQRARERCGNPGVRR